MKVFSGAQSLYIRLLNSVKRSFTSDQFGFMIAKVHKNSAPPLEFCTIFKFCCSNLSANPTNYRSFLWASPIIAVQTSCVYITTNWLNVLWSTVSFVFIWVQKRTRCHLLSPLLENWDKSWPLEKKKRILFFFYEMLAL